jgi:hypothetical protein
LASRFHLCPGPGTIIIIVIAIIIMADGGGQSAGGSRPSFSSFWRKGKEKLKGKDITFVEQGAAQKEQQAGTGEANTTCEFEISFILCCFTWAHFHSFTMKVVINECAAFPTYAASQ